MENEKIEDECKEGDEEIVIRIDKDKLSELMDFTGLVDEVIIKLDEEGMHILQMDPSQIAEMRIDVPKDQLLEYRINEPQKLYFDRNKIKEILKVIDKGDVIIRKNKDNIENLTLLADDSEFSVPLLEAQEGIVKEPQYQTDYEITLPAKDLLNKIKEAELFGTHVAFQTDGIEFNWNWENKYKTRFKNFSLVAAHPENIQPARAVYPLKYLQEILSGIRKYLVKIYFRTNSPIKIVVVKDGINVLYYLAPRVESV